MARLAQELGKCPELFVQVNTGNEKQKSGVLPKETEPFVKECLDMDLPVKGLMCIPPVDEEASLHFALLKKISENCGLTYLSMGMSADFEKAISFGATHIRVGSAIFGERSERAEERDAQTMASVGMEGCVGFSRTVSTKPCNTSLCNLPARASPTGEGGRSDADLSSKQRSSKLREVIRGRKVDGFDRPTVWARSRPFPRL